MVFPLFKLGTLALKTACKPIANRLKKEASLHPRFRQRIINFAQVFLYLYLFLKFLYFDYPSFSLALVCFANVVLMLYSPQIFLIYIQQVKLCNLLFLVFFLLILYDSFCLGE